MNDTCVGELKYRSSVEGVDHNIHVALKSFIVKPVCRSLQLVSSVPPTQTPEATFDVVSHHPMLVLSLSLLYVCSCLQRRFSATISVLSGLGKRKLEDLNGRRKTILLSLNLFDRNYFITGIKAKGAQRRGACVHTCFSCVGVFLGVLLWHSLANNCT